MAVHIRSPRHSISSRPYILTAINKVIIMRSFNRTGCLLTLGLLALASVQGSAASTADPAWQRDTTTAVVDVLNPATGRTWMDRNLGATRAATSSTDSQAFGDLYQWGRAADGHQRRNSPTTRHPSSNDQPGHGSFVSGTGNSNWRTPRNDNLWVLLTHPWVMTSLVAVGRARRV